ncbi:MAG: ribonuclease M5 [Bacillota bacterium]|nr:ribonuclease M5 [Bacillota bacterium]
MKKIDAIIVVEGITDKAFLSTFIDAEFVTTNGSDVPRETLDYLKESSKTKDIIVLTDPDFPGKRIRDVIDENVPGCVHAYIRKEAAIKHHKVGVAESNEDEVLTALSHAIPNKKSPKGDLTPADLYDLGLLGGSESSNLRKKVGEKLHLGHTNGKSLLQRLNSLGISREKLEEALHE